jgi:NADH:ubiquinone oxidoreductase subunit 5 (subunit L)/multisubunit Na+/H+ antiporter MnhA subunit
MVLGIGTGTAVGVAGGLFHMLNHAIYKACLFLCAGAVEKRTGTTDLDRLGGLAKAMPLTFGSCLVGALAISGIPPLNGFASKWMVYQGIVQTASDGGLQWVVWLVAAMLGSALTLASFVKALHAVFLRRPAPALAAKPVSEVGVAMWLPTALLAATCIVFGVLWYRLPLRHMIFPAIGGAVDFPGAWRGGVAAVLLGVAYLVGLGIYRLTSGRRPRACETYIGGEILDDTYISGEPAEGERDVEVTGVDFYDSIESLIPLRAVYRAAKNKWFDLYEVGTKVIFYFVEALRRAHTGVLPVYLTWFLIGFLAVLWVLAYGAK